MKNKVLVIALALLSVLVLASCGKSNEPPQITAPTNTGTNKPSGSGLIKHEWVDGENRFGDVKYPAAPEKYDGIYERGYNFSVFYTEANAKPFLIQLFRDSGDMVETIETVNPPIIKENIVADADVLAVSVAEGESDPYKVTFYDVDSGKKSESRENFITAQYGYAVFVTEEGFVIRDMFDDSVFYKELPIDTKGFDKADHTHMTAQFSPNGKHIVVSYTVDGKDYDKPFKLQ